MKPKTYILQKDLPGISKGTSFVQHPKYVNRWYPDNYYEDGELICNEQSIHGFLTDNIINNPEWFKLKVEKPPLGLIPLYLHNYNRLNDIKVAIVRYKEVGKDVPQEWLFEENDLETKLGLDYNENQARINQKSHTKNS